MHDQEWYHNDLKAENVAIFKAEDGTPTAKLIDFGLATKGWPRCVSVSEFSQCRTDGYLSSLVNGTIAAMSPENIHARFMHSWYRKSGKLDVVLDDLHNMESCTGVHTAGERDVWGIGIIL